MSCVPLAYTIMRARRDKAYPRAATFERWQRFVLEEAESRHGPDALTHWSISFAFPYDEETICNRNWDDNERGKARANGRGGGGGAGRHLNPR
jgi:hypothetical protein